MLQLVLATDYEKVADSIEKIVLIILNKGADVNYGSVNGETSLHIAAKYGHEEVIKIFLEHSANPFLVNKSNQVPIDVALNHNRNNIVTLLLEFMKKKLNEEIYKENIQIWNSTKEC